MDAAKTIERIRRYLSYIDCEINVKQPDKTDFNYVDNQIQLIYADLEKLDNVMTTERNNQCGKS